MSISVRKQKDPKWIAAGKKAAETRRLRELGEAGEGTSSPITSETSAVHASSAFELQATVNVNYNIQKMKNYEVDRPWIEKYRPNTLNECIGSVIGYFKAFVKTGSFPLSFVFHGFFGEGKTAVAKCFVRDFYVTHGSYKKTSTFNDILAGTNSTRKDEMFSPVLYLNAGSFKGTFDSAISKEIVDRISKFMKYSAGSNIKFVIADEADLFGFTVQDAISSLIEKHERTRTIWITNYINQIRDRIISRASGGVFEFKKPTNKELAKHLEMICSKEKIKIPKNKITEIVETAPCVRDAIGMLQREAVLVKATRRK